MSPFTQSAFGRTSTRIVNSAAGVLLFCLAGCGGQLPPPKQADIGLPSFDTPTDGDASRVPRTGNAAGGWKGAMQSLAESLSRDLRVTGGGTTKLAVLELSGAEAYGDDFVSMTWNFLTLPLFRSERFKIVERRQLSILLDELKLSLSDLMDPHSVARIGKLLGADAVVCGSVQPFRGGHEVRARVVLVESSQVASSGRVRVATGELTPDG